jgi:hypothetical protein
VQYGNTHFKAVSSSALLARIRIQVLTRLINLTTLLEQDLVNLQCNIELTSWVTVLTLNDHERWNILHGIQSYFDDAEVINRMIAVLAKV